MQIKRMGMPRSKYVVRGAVELSRIVSSLCERGARNAARVPRVKRRLGTQNWPWVLRKPRDYGVEKPGDLVELDTMNLGPAPEHARVLLIHVKLAATM